jgi:integrase
MAKRRGFKDGSIDRKNGQIYRLRYSLNGKRYCQPFSGSTAAAKAKLRELLTSADRGEHVEPDKVTLAQWVDQWVKAGCPGRKQKRGSKKTVERYDELLKVHVLPVLGDRPLQKLASTEIDELYSKIRDRERPLAPLTRRHLHSVFKACLATALRTKKIAANPMVSILQMLADDGDSADPDNNKDDIGEGLSETELAALVTGFRKWPAMFPVVALAAGTGARRGELLALRWSDLDVGKRKLRIERALEQTRELGVRFKPPKTERGFRTIDLDAAIVEMLLQEKVKLQRLKAGIPDGVDVDTGLVKLPERALMFPSTEGEFDFCKPRNPRGFTQSFADRAGQIGFGRVRFHDLRGIHATALLDAGVPAHRVAQRIGDDPSTLLKWYVKRQRTGEADQKEAAAITAMSKSIFGK